MSINQDRYQEGEEFSIASLSEAQNAVGKARKMSDEELSNMTPAYTRRVTVGEKPYDIILAPEALEPGDTNKGNLVLDISPIDRATAGMEKVLTTVRRGRIFLGTQRLVWGPEGLIGSHRLDHEGEEVPGEFSLGHEPKRIAATRLSIRTERMP